MLFRPSFIAPLKADIKAEFMNLYGKALVVPDDKLLDFVRDNNFTALHESSTHFRRVIHYYHEKYSFIPSFQHLVSGRIPVLKGTAGWEQSITRRFPQFRPYLFSPGKTALSEDYAAYENLLCSEEMAQLALALAAAVQFSYRLRYVPSAVAFLERAVFTLAFRNVKTDMPFLNLIKAHARLSALRRPKRDSSKAWLSAHFGYAVNRRILYKINGVYFPWWNALKIIVSDKHWDEYGGDVDRETIFHDWLVATESKGVAASVLTDENPMPLSHSEVDVLMTIPKYSEIIKFYPYMVV